MSMSSSYRSSSGSVRGTHGYAAAVAHHLYTGTNGLLGLWLWERHLRIPKRDLGARVHSLWILRIPKGALGTCMRYYAGYVVVPGVKTVSTRFKDSLEGLERALAVAMPPKEIEALEYLEDPLCGDTGCFPLFHKATPRSVARVFLERLYSAGHDLAALNPKHFKETYANRRGTPR